MHVPGTGVPVPGPAFLPVINMPMGDGGAAPMQVEIGEDDAHDPTGEFIARGINCFSKI